MDNTNLPTTQNNFINQNPIAVLKNLNAFAKIKEFDKVGHLVIPICNKHAVLSGITLKIDEFTKEEIAKYTSLHLKNLTFEEVEIAFQNERFNLYETKSNHYNFFSIDYFVEIITKYKDWKKNQMIIHNIPINQTLLPGNTKPANDEDKKEIRREFIKMLFEELQKPESEYISDAFTLYEDFVEHKLIVVSDEEKIALYKIIKKRTIKDTNQQISKSSNQNLKKELKLYIEKLNNHNKDLLIANRCKAYLVCQSIKSFISAESILKKIDL